ncbi:winged helix-turn-helix domain-containing protein [Faunimonas pinastri]|uniref:winged helix-turn-helix domain-containing protein n=1 Tax=Faunimonas pinastri TaxID=1855383 RepID=UPI000B821983|nr:crosslink repair DNA glycosylase YcaQ family protein [Faunimonas pinastri]
MKETLSASEARRIALSAQGFGLSHPIGAIDQGHLRRVLDRIALHQIDSVNVLARAHYLPLFSRLGPYSRDLLDKAAWGKPRRLFEYWAHEASLLPLDFHPLLRWRMARAERGQGTWSRVAPYAGERRHEAEALLARIATEGPLAASDVTETRSKSGWWEWSDAKHAMEWLFWSGRITALTRRTSFERVYDLPERVLPRAVVEAPTPTEADAQRELLDRSARALGIATAGDIRDYFRLKPADALPRIAELVEAGRLLPVQVKGWPQQAYLHVDAKPRRRISGQALLVPFDPLIWERSRAERLFGMRYRIEIYTPAEKRVHGYYVLPFLMDGEIVARVDLKSDRQSRRLLVQSALLEPQAPAETPERLASELSLMADWLDLEGVEVVGGGELADPLRATFG